MGLNGGGMGLARALPGPFDRVVDIPVRVARGTLDLFPSVGSAALTFLRIPLTLGKIGVGVNYSDPYFACGSWRP